MEADLAFLSDEKRVQYSAMTGRWFDDLPAVMRLRITTPMVMKALRKLDPNAARPFNFAISPILTEHIANCTLISKFNKHPETWMTQEYTEIHSGKKVKLNGKFAGR